MTMLCALEDQRCAKKAEGPQFETTLFAGAKSVGGKYKVANICADPFPNLWFLSGSSTRISLKVKNLK